MKPSPKPFFRSTLGTLRSCHEFCEDVLVVVDLIGVAAFLPNSRRRDRRLSCF